MVSDKLRNGPIHVTRAAQSNSVGGQSLFAQARSYEKHLKIEIEGSLALISIIPQVQQRPRVTFRTRTLRSSKRSECFWSDHPGRNSGLKVLGQKWSQRLVLPTLNVTCGPVVKEAEPHYMLIGLADWNRFTKSIPWSDPYPEFKLVV
jgi:hypothetical protein